MVAEVWIPNPDNHPIVNHINGVKTDNRVENLEWCSASHNQKHAWDNGLNHSSTARRVVFCETGQVFASPQKCVDEMGWGNLASSITCCCKRSDKTKTKRRKIKGYTVRYYEPTPLVERLLNCGYGKYPESYDPDIYFCYLCLAQKWLREVKGIDIEPRVWLVGGKREYRPYVMPPKCKDYIALPPEESYEKALSSGIDEALVILTNNPK